MQLDDLIIDPVVRLLYLELAPAQLGTERGELQRVFAALRETHGVETARCTLQALRSLQLALERRGGAITVAVHHEAGITGVWPGFVDTAFGIAFDVGSTTIVAHLCDLATGEVVASAGAMNPQIRFGEDLMSRVSHIMMHPGAEVELTACVREALNNLIGEVVARSDTTQEHVLECQLLPRPQRIPGGGERPV